jgi:hypothetical protein
MVPREFLLASFSQANLALEEDVFNFVLVLLGSRLMQASERRRVRGKSVLKERLWENYFCAHGNNKIKII